MGVVALGNFDGPIFLISFVSVSAASGSRQRSRSPRRSPSELRQEYATLQKRAAAVFKSLDGEAMETHLSSLRTVVVAMEVEAENSIAEIGEQHEGGFPGRGGRPSQVPYSPESGGQDIECICQV